MNIAIQINKQILTAVPEGPLVAASVGVVTCTAEFDPGWEGFTQTLVFERDGLSRAVLWTGETVTVPWEVLAQPGLLYISALGVREGMRKPTAVMEEPLSVRPSGCLAGKNSGEFSEALWSQTLAEVQRLRDEAVRAAEAAAQAAEAMEALLGSGGVSVQPGTQEPVRWADVLDKPYDYEVSGILYMGRIGALTPWTGTYKDLDTPVPLVEGTAYEVLWDEVPYLCTFDGVLGNPSLVDPAETNTGEPFALELLVGGLRVYGYTGAELSLSINTVRVLRRLHGDFVQGMVDPVEKTEAMTQPVGVDADGRLWTEMPAVQAGSVPTPAIAASATNAFMTTTATQYAAVESTAVAITEA